jgi:guanylate kinase
VSVAGEKKTREPRGNIIVVSAPSGAGKTTLIHRLRAAMPELAFSVSYTTRPPRPGERNGREYFFVSPKSFRDMIHRGAFAEWAKVHTNLYGTARRQLRAAQKAGRDIVLDIDVQGYRRLKRGFPEAAGIFVLPPAYGELVHRLKNRHQDSPEAIARRLEDARKEIGYWRDYDYLIVNNDLKEASRALRAIVIAIQHRPESLGCRVQYLWKKLGG